MNFGTLHWWLSGATLSHSQSFRQVLRWAKVDPVRVTPNRAAVLVLANESPKLVFFGLGEGGCGVGHVLASGSRCAKWDILKCPKVAR